MSAYIVINDGTDRAAWHAARDGLVTATDVAKIMTGGPGTWATLKKTKATGSEFRGNRYTEWGNEREPLIVEHLSAHHGLRPNRALIGSRIIPEYAATPDAISDDGTTIGEVKTTVNDWTGLDSTLASFRKNGIADYWQQIQWQLYVTGARVCLFAYEAHEDFIPIRPEPTVVIVERDDDAISLALDRVAEWEAFDADGVDAPDGLDDLLADRRLFREAADAATARVTAVEAEIRALIEAHGKPLTYKGPGVNVSWSGKPVSTSRFDSTAFKAADPATYEQFTKTTETQPRLTFTAPRS